jgi:hypothetical protein
MGVGQSEEGSMWQLCKFNASVLTREGRRRDKMLSDD